MIKKVSRPDVIVPILVFVVLMLQLYLGHMVGLADNGDFERILASTGLKVTPDVANNPLIHYFNYWNRFYLEGKTVGFFYPSSVIPVIELAKSISILFGHALDVAVLGVIYSLLMSLGAFLAVRFMMKKMDTKAVYVASIIGTLILVDLSYTAYFNSLYSEPMIFVSLIIMVASGYLLTTQKKPGYATFIVFTLSSLAFITAKLQDFPLLVLIIPFMIRLIFLHRDIVWKALVPVCGLLVMATSIYTYHHNSPVLRDQNVYDSVFDGVLTNPSTVKQDLQWLGLPSKYSVLAGNAYFAKHPININSTDFQRNFYDKVTPVKVAEFYLRHPTRMYQMLQDSQIASLESRPPYLGNFTPQSGMPPRSQSNRLDVWSFIESTVIPKSFVLWIVFYAGFIAMLINLYIKATDKNARMRIEFTSMLVLMSIVSFPIAYVAEGNDELIKHMYTYNCLLGVTVAIILSWAVYSTSAEVKPSRGNEKDVIPYPDVTRSVK